jgi:hypothetical protein
LPGSSSEKPLSVTSDASEPHRARIAAVLAGSAPTVNSGGLKHFRPGREMAKARVVFDGDASVREIVDRRVNHRRRGDVVDHVDVEIALADRAEIEQSAQELRVLLARYFGMLAEIARRANADR